jgi:hypothetical protein
MRAAGGVLEVGELLFFIWLIAAAIIIVSLTHISLLIISATKWKRQAEVYRRHEAVNSKAEKYEPDQNDTGGPVVDFSALLSTIKAEGRANRAEEKREDDASNLREWLTIVLIAFTLITVGWQVNEMVKVYGPIKEQADAAKISADTAIKQAENSERSLIQAQRAWVGPRNAVFAAEPVVGKPFEITITYENSGHEPAIAFISFVEAFGMKIINDREGYENIKQDMSGCRDSKQWPGGSIIYPGGSSFGSGYNLSIKTKDDFVTDGMVKGNELIIVQGCFSYKTFDQPKHSSFCYFYKQGVSKASNMNICPSGHEAD